MVFFLGFSMFFFFIRVFFEFSMFFFLGFS